MAVPLVVWCAAVTLAAGRSETPQAAIAPQIPAPVSAGAETCARCHASVHQRWGAGRHSKMLQPASPGTVLGGFTGAPVRLRGASFTLTRVEDQYFVRGPFPTSKEEQHRVEFTLGSRRVQHYLTRLADGRLVVLPPTWDVARGEWFHNLDIVNPDDAAENPVQVWNSSCFACHVSGGAKGYDDSRATYDTRWVDFGTNCERCHGRVAAHVVWAEMPAANRKGDPAIVVPSRLPAERSTMVCAQCHSLRDITVPGFAAGDDYFDHFTPVLEYAQPPSKDPPYWADGRPRRFSNDAIGFWQSRCFLDGGATCITCHFDPHEPDIDRNPQLARSNNSICAKCHAPIVEAGTRHTRHARESAGSSCIACHMPRTVVSLRAQMPDHTIGVPAPENTVRHGIPNACSECHQDREPSWAVRALAEWYPTGRRQQIIARADTFTAARRGESTALDGLIRIAMDARQPPIVRANAVGYLRRFPGTRAEAYLAAAASSEHPAIRLSAVLGLGEAGFPAASVTPVLINALADSHRVVRVGAALSLMNARVTQLEGQAGVLLEQAKRDYLLRAMLLSDDARVMLDVGKFHLMNKDLAAATKSLETSLRLDLRLHASRYFLALALVAQGRTADARMLLLRIPQTDPYGPAAVKILATLPPKI